MMISVALLLAGSSVAAGQGKAYSLDDLVGLLKRKVASTRVLTLAKQNCISFVMTPDVETVLKRAGGTSDLISGLETVCNPNNPKVAADTAHRVMPGAVPVPVASAPVDTFVPVVIRAAVVNPDLTVRPLPQLDLLLITPRGDSLHVSTDLEGKFTRSLRPGGYRIESMAEVAGMRYRWAFNAVIARDMAPIELTQKNASVEAVNPLGAAAGGTAIATHDTVRIAAPPPPRVLTEKEIFERDRSGLFMVYGTEFRGTGFYADSNGFVLTNLHLVEFSDDIRVQFDSVTKVYARVIAKDRDKDIAVLAVNPKRCPKCAVLQFPDSAHSAPPGPGDRVLAFGSPLNKLGVFSLGLVSNADANTVTSDVAVGEFNTGGPLVSKDGFVLGLNSDKAASDQGGTRVETSVATPVLLPFMAKARDSIPSLVAKPVSDELLPIVPREPFPMAPIAAVAKLGKDMNIEVYQAEQGPFKIFMMTPQLMAWRQQQAVNALSDKKQDDPKRYGTFTKIDPIQGWTDWDDFLNDRKAVIVFNVFPDRTEFPYYQPDKVQNVSEGSFGNMRIFRDGVEIIPVEKVRVPAMLNVEQMKLAGKAMPYQGIYVYRVNDFAPRAVGSTATYTVTITDQATLKQYKLTLQGKMIEQMWKDFTAYQYGGH